MTLSPDRSNTNTHRVAEGTPYLLFRASDKVYAIEVASVREILLLPALKPLAEKSAALVGLLNVRGVIVPVLDLELRLGRMPKAYSLEHRLLLLQCGDRSLAIVVAAVLGVERIAVEQTQSNPSDAPSAAAIVRGVAKVRDEIAMLLNVEHLFASVSHPSTEFDSAAEFHGEDVDLTTYCFQGLSDAERAELIERAGNLRQSMGGDDAEVNSMAVAEIGQELFAFEFDFVHEFFDAQRITPIPCCPRHIVGNVNLRGSILTIVDVRDALNLPAVRPGNGGKAVVVKIDEWEVGILVDALHDVVNVKTADIISPGVTLPNRPVKGTAKYNGRLMSIIDLPILLRLEDWQVNETV